MRHESHSSGLLHDSIHDITPFLRQFPDGLHVTYRYAPSLTSRISKYSLNRCMTMLLHSVWRGSQRVHEVLFMPTKWLGQERATMNLYRGAERSPGLIDLRRGAIISGVIAVIAFTGCASRKPSHVPRERVPSAEREPEGGGMTSEVESCAECAKLGLDCVHGYGLEHPGKLHCAPGQPGTEEFTKE